jgi:hypothetical protein
MRPSKLLLFPLLLVLAFSLTPFSIAQETNNNVRAVRISHVEGTVQLSGSGGVTFDQAHANMPVTQGMVLKTGNDGNVEVQFEDGSVTRATPNSSLRFDQLQRNSEGETETQITALSGLSYYELNNRGGKYAVHFGPYTAVAAKSSIFRLSLDQNPAQLAVMHGAVHIETDNEGGLDVPTSETASLDMKDASSYDVAHNIVADSWDQWNSDRDQYLAKLGAKATMARALSNSPDDPAWSDLDYYGNWYNFPGYGAGWMPAGMGTGWDPFGSGYWGYYPAYGYTWISGYPWGWLPYHCGMWNWFDGAGWAWFPGNCGWGTYGNGWYPVTTVWNCPQNYVPPARPKPIVPVRGPIHMPPQQALIAVDRSSGNGQLGVINGNKPIATPIRVKFDGKTLHPIEATVRPKVAGPLGESFKVASGYVPSRAGAIEGPRSRALPASGGLSGPVGIAPPEMPRNTIAPITPRNTLAPAPRISAPPVYHPAPTGGAIYGGGAPHISAPSYSAPAAPHISAPVSAAPSGGGANHH